VSLAATATDADGDPLTYAATGLPPNLAIDPQSGLITGTIAAGARAGSPYHVTVSVREGATPDATDTFNWVIGTEVANQRFESLDGGGGTHGQTLDDVGATSSALTYNGQAHVWYYDRTAGDLRHGWWDGARWNFETLDGSGGANGRVDADVGAYPAALVYAGQAHVWYHDKSAGALRHAWWDGARWNFETLDGDGGANGRTANDVGEYDAVTLYGNQPHVWYDDATGGNLRHAWWDGARWNFETLDGNGGPNGRADSNVGRYNTVTLYGGQPHVFFQDITNADMRHAWWDGVQWRFEALDGNGGTHGETTNRVGFDNAALVYGTPHVWYEDADDGALRHAWWDGAHWNFETLDGNGGPNGAITSQVGTFNAVMLFRGLPNVWYYDATGGNLRHGWWDGGRWNFETLDGTGGSGGRVNADVGQYNAVTLYGGAPHVWSYDASGGDLRHGWMG
jgi:hypothetical protein